MCENTRAACGSQKRIRTTRNPSQSDGSKKKRSQSIAQKPQPIRVLENPSQSDRLVTIDMNYFAPYSKGIYECLTNRMNYVYNPVIGCF